MSDQDQTPEPSIEIPPAELDPGTLHAIVESFVLREGTDYGQREFSLPEKVEHVMQQLRLGTARIMFDPASQSVSIVTTRDARAARGPGTSDPPP